MPDILHRVGIDAPAQKVFDALTTVDGLRGWWISNASGNAAAGGVVDFGFSKMAVTTARPGELVEWKCVEGPPEWVGTTLSFQLESKRDQTFVLFKHADWKEPVEFMHHCSTKWAVFLLSLRDWLERSEGRPAPYDIKIHVGD